MATLHPRTTLQEQCAQPASLTRHERPFHECHSRGKLQIFDLRHSAQPMLLCDIFRPMLIFLCEALFQMAEQEQEREWEQEQEEKQVQE